MSDKTNEGAEPVSSNQYSGKANGLEDQAAYPSDGQMMRDWDPKLSELLKQMKLSETNPTFENRLMDAYRQHIKRTSFWRKVLPLGQLKDWILNLLPRGLSPIFAMALSIIALGLFGLAVYYHFAAKETNRQELVTVNKVSPEGQEATRSGNSLQDGIELASVKRVFIESLGDNSFGQELRKALVENLQANGKLVVVKNREEAEAVFKGSIKNDESVSIKLINRAGTILWSKDVSIRISYSDAAASIVSDLLKSIDDSSKQGSKKS